MADVERIATPAPQRLVVVLVHNSAGVLRLDAPAGHPVTGEDFEVSIDALDEM